MVEFGRCSGTDIGHGHCIKSGNETGITGSAPAPSNALIYVGIIGGIILVFIIFVLASAGYMIMKKRAKKACSYSFV